MKKIFDNLLIKIILFSLIFLIVGGMLANAFIQMLLGDNFNYIVGYILSGQILIIFSIIIFGFLILNKL